MRNIQSRLQKLEQDRPEEIDNARIRDIVRSLTLEEARFCLWVLRWEDWEDEDSESPSDHPKPTKADIRRFNKLLKGVWQ